MGIAAILAACGSTPPTPSPSAPAAATPPTSPDPTAAFEARQLQAAEAAARQARWADALWAWDVLLTLRPGYAEYATRRQLAQAQLDALLADRLARADAARRRGDADAAATLYLGALALTPGHAPAAEALRALERERVQRQHLGKLSRLTLLRQSPAPRTTARADHRAATKPEAAPSRNGGDRNVVEHAAMLSAQGEVDAAIGLLQAHLAQRRADPAAQKMLADLLEQRQADGTTRGLRPAAAASAALNSR